MIYIIYIRYHRKFLFYCRIFHFHIHDNLNILGDRYVPEVEVSELSNIILETIASLNEINPLTGRLIQIARDGKISDDEIKDFAFISKKLDEVSLAIDS